MSSNTTSRVAAGVAVGLIVGSVPAMADTDGESAQLAPLVVTPTRMTQTVDESLSSVSVIDRDEIDRQQPRQVSDLLQGRAGTSLASNGPFGKDTSLFMRGTESDHTLLLVDGVPMNSATSGGAAWQYLPPAEIDRIEVVRGPRTSIYGADAIGGVVQVFTREGEEGPPRFRAFGGAGSFNTHEFGVGVSGGTAASRYALSASQYETDGINVHDEFGDDRLNGFDNTSLSGRFSHRLPGGSELFTTVMRSEGTTEYDVRADEDDFTDYLFQALRGGVRGDITERWFSELAVSQAKDEQDNVDSRGETWQYTERHEVSWRNELYWGDGHIWAFGGDWRDEQVDTADDYDETSRYNAGAYTQLELDLGRHDLGSSLRYDDNEAYGDNVTGQLAWGVDVTDRLRLRSSYGTAFKAPTFNNLYGPQRDPSPPFSGWRSNPDLEAEESVSAEVGARWQARKGYVDVALFQTDIDNLIADRLVETDLQQPFNVDEARIRGAELEAGAHWQEWQISGAFTYLDHEDRETGDELARRPNESLRLDLDRQLGDFSVGATGIARGRSFDRGERVSGYGLLNLRTSYAITPEWTLRGTLENALDKDYETVSGYNQPGRAVYVSLHFNQH
ncbi:MAG: TonB-dependent receptor [Halorhodospira halophila]|uniref:TonB-dependent receptor domain-containing protein n=1 Tax=Halorhodospira halophila TaxID=1053 RepID=UPI0026F02609|nr:TonB-dependent receptor [Halorhodospira halophila]MCC3751705.1 TonB-dependent receptor [Halorhodospira halophila]